MRTIMSTTEWVLWLALAIGLLYGVVAQVSGFCLNSALRHQFTEGKGTKLRSFALAMLVAIVGTQLAASFELIDLSQSIYQNPQASWLLIVVGGILFGFGMLRARGCGARALVLFGQGNLRSLVVLLCVGISAFMTLTGILGPLRDTINQATLITLESNTFTSETGRWGFVIVFGLVLAFYITRDRQFWQHKRDVLAGLVIGLLILAGWLVTGWIGFDEFEPKPVTSLTFVAPIGSTIQYSMIATGMELNFGIVTVIGVVLGAFVAARLGGQFKLLGFEKPTDMPRYLVGAVCMGVGGALAMGCSVGQGLTGMSTLSFTSMLAFLGICIGGWIAVRSERLAVTSPKPVQRQAASQQYQQSTGTSK